MEEKPAEILEYHQAEKPESGFKVYVIGQVLAGTALFTVVAGAIIIVAVAYDQFSKRGKAKTTILKSDAKGDTVPPASGETPTAAAGGARARP